MTGHTDESRRLNDKLKNDEELFLSLVDQMTDTVAIIDWDGTILFTNPAGAKQIGMESPEDCIGVNVLEFVHPDFMASVIRDLELIKEGKRGSLFADFRIYKIKTRKGEERWVEGIGKKIQYKGSPVDLITIRDVTERMRMEEELKHYREQLENLVKKRTAELRKANKRLREEIAERTQAEEALRLSEENFHRSLNDSPLGVCIVNVEGEIIYANRVVLDFCGYNSIDELKATPVIKRYTPECFAEFQIRREKRKRGDYDPSEYEIGIIRKDGEVRHIQVYRKEVLWDGERQFQVLYNDITVRKRAEEALRKSGEQYRSLVESTTDAIYVIDRNLRYLFANSTYLSRIGFTLDKIVNRSYDDIHPRMYDLFPEHIAFVLETGQSTSHEYKSFKDQRNFLRTLSPIKDERGKTVAVTVISKDITDIRKTDAELRSSREQLRALAGKILKAREEERTEMAREIHDELGGALSSLKIDISLLENELLKKVDATEMSSLLERMHSMTELINDTVAAMREITMKLRPGILDDSGLVAAIEWQLNDFSGRTGIKVTFLSDLGDKLYDKDVSTAMFRILQETLTNIVRHAHADNVTVELKESSGNVVLEVRDDGVGIREEKVLGAKSLGPLGMRERAELFGGKVHVAGMRGKGTTVTVTIPLEHYLQEN
jgi:PAS domain S-box-containing protein